MQRGVLLKPVSIYKVSAFDRAAAFRVGCGFCGKAKALAKG